MRFHAGRGRLERAWDTDTQADPVQLLADSHLWHHAHGAELLDEQNSDLERYQALSCQASFAC